jgi:hypothetical protein
MGRRKLRQSQTLARWKVSRPSAPGRRRLAHPQAPGHRKLRPMLRDMRSCPSQEGGRQKLPQPKPRLMPRSGVLAGGFARRVGLCRSTNSKCARDAEGLHTAGGSARRLIGLSIRASAAVEGCRRYMHVERECVATPGFTLWMLTQNGVSLGLAMNKYPGGNWGRFASQTMACQ